MLYIIDIHLYKFLCVIVFNSQSAYFGRIVKGMIHYTNGFISTVDEIGLLQDPNTGTLDDLKNTAEYSLKLHMLNLMTFFDFTADLTETKISGTVAIPIANIDFRIEVITIQLCF